MESTNLTLIDAGITSLKKDVVLTPTMTSLNLHFNFIKTIENLHALCNLQHLDLSSNQIKVIKGLDKLSSLKTLNLSCNQIEKVQGFDNLYSLIKVNLSYNVINDISGFIIFSGASYQLERVDLQGNRVPSQKMVIDSFRNCTSLRKLILRADGADNPVCGSRNYRVSLMTSLIQIQVLDWSDRAGNLIVDHGSDIPGLDDYLAQILPSSSSEAMMHIETPKIDAAIDKFKQREQELAVTTSESSESYECAKIVEAQKHELDRLHRIEQQLAQLLEAREAKENKNPRKQVPKRDTDVTDDSDSSDKAKRRDSKQKIPLAQLSKTPPSRRALKSKQATARTQDESMKKEVASTYQHLVEDLNSERERRFKAEHAARQLTERVKQLQMESKLYDEKKGIAFEASSKLKDALLHLKEEVKNLKEENQALKEDLLDYQNRLEQIKEAHQTSLVAMKSMEESVAKMESEKHQNNAHYTKLIHSAESKTAAAHREIDILHVQIKEKKNTVQQLQQLLASREQEHKTELEQRYTLGSPEIRELLQKEASHVEAVYQNRISTFQVQLESSRTQYAELEDEFRTALHIEANRYGKLHDAFSKLSEDFDVNKHELVALRHKEEKGAQLVAELTQLVKEQKGRIAELAKSKHDQLQDQKDRIQTLEAHLEEARRRIVQHELLKQDNKRIQAQLDAQESIIEGLRSERKLWGQELAQQGSSLAQDRGRLEAKIEALNHEISYLKKQLETEVDSVKIKSKLIDDQTETIRHLKDALLERDEKVKSAREEILTVQKKLENELCEEKQAYRDAQEEIESLTERKQDLKEKVRQLENAVEIERENQGKINSKWKEKSDLIGNLESQVFAIRENWEKKEKELTEEKDKALKAANLAIDKMRQMDDAFRRQYEHTQRSHQEQLRRVGAEKQGEIDRARERVAEVENEMRTLLKEQEESKRLAEERIRKMGQAFSELQQQLF